MTTNSIFTVTVIAKLHYAFIIIIIIWVIDKKSFRKVKESFLLYLLSKEKKYSFEKIEKLFLLLMLEYISIDWRRTMKSELKNDSQVKLCLSGGGGDEIWITFRFEFLLPTANINKSHFRHILKISLMERADQMVEWFKLMNDFSFRRTMMMMSILAPFSGVG